MTSRLALQAESRIDSWSGRRTFLLVFGAMAVLYVATMARFDFESSTDTIASALPAWRLAQFGDLNLSGFEQLPWIGEINGSILSNRTPGISFIATPMYWLLGSREFEGAVPSMLPATITAAIMSAGAVAILHLSFRRLVTPTVAVGAALAFGTATSTWSISANELWPHGPAQFFLAIGMLALAGSRYLTVGVAYGAALLIRPVTAIIAGVSGIYTGWKQRSWRPVVLVGLGAVGGLFLLMLYNRLVLGTWSPVPPSYGQSFVRRAGRQSGWAYLGDVLGMLFHPKFGVLVFSPVLLFALPGLREGWHRADLWVRAGGVGGLLFILIHLRLNRFGGGLLYGYRYPLEMLIVIAPLLLLSWRSWFDRAAPLMRRLFWLALAVSVVRQVYSIAVGFENPWLI